VKVTCFALDPDGGLTPETEATALAGWRAGGASHWIDLSGGTSEAVTGWLAALGIDSAVVEELGIGNDESRILPLRDLVFVAYPIVAGEEAPTPSLLGCLCLDRLVVTMRTQPDGPSGWDEAFLGKSKLREGTTAGVVCALAVVQSARLRRHVGRLRAEGDVLAGRMDSDPEAVSFEEILALKRRVLGIGGVVDEELAVLEVLKISNHDVLPLSRLGEAFQAAIENARASDRGADRLDRRVTDLQHRYEAAQQDKMNRRIGLLTVLSAIFMPLTLIAGIYGMNFEVMPELHYRYSYPLVLAGMGLIAAGLFWYFRSRWWPKR
jgi:Mg2+ and Co2+ transporter CorA